MLKIFPSRSFHLFAPDGIGRGRQHEQYDLFATFASSSSPPAPRMPVAAHSPAQPTPKELISPTPATAAEFEIATAPEPAMPPAASPAPVTPRVRAVEPGYAWGPGRVEAAARRHLNGKAIALFNGIKKEAQVSTIEDAQTLARYSGAGGIGDSLNEYYTPEPIADVMWELVHKAGFAGGLALEPSCGTGIFMRTASTNTRVVGVEMSEVSAGIARLLHAEHGHEIIHSSFEIMATTDPREFDLVIGNPPFGVRGETVRDHKRHVATAQEYFLDTALDKCRTGGLVAFVLPTGVMDNPSLRQFRAGLLLKGEFVSAWRLPNVVFRQTGTNIPTDILLLRRREQEVALTAQHLDAPQRAAIGLWDEEFIDGLYFDGAGTSHVLGATEAGWRARSGLGNDIAVDGTIEQAVAALAAWEAPPPAKAVSIEAIFEAAQSEQTQDRMRRSLLGASSRQAAPGDVKIVGGIRYVLRQYAEEAPNWEATPGEVPPAVRAAHEIGEEIGILAAGGWADRRSIMARLEQFQAEFGNPASNQAIQGWMRAPFWDVEQGQSREKARQAVLQARRVIGHTIGAIQPDGAGYSDLLTGAQRDTPKLDIPGAIAVASAATECFTATEVARLVGTTSSEINAYIEQTGGYAVLPDGVSWEAEDKYYSGDLWPKYDAARAGSEDPNLPESLRAHLAAQMTRLHDTIAPVGLEQVEIQMNSGFITPEDLTAWLLERSSVFEGKDYERPQPATVTYANAVYIVAPTYDTKHLSSDNDLISNFLNREGIKKTEISRIDSLNAEFRVWALGGPHRDAIETRYNRSYRGYAKRTYSLEPINIPGLNPNRKLNGYHYAALRWAIETGGGISAYDVGLGKTTFGLLLGRLAVAMGRAERPAYVVPLSVIANWEAEAKSWFPDCTTMIVGETRVTKKDGTVTAKSDSAAVIRTKLLQARQTNVDFVFITEPAWNRLDLNPEKKAELVDQDFWVQRGDAMGHAGTKKQKKIKEAFLQASAAREFSSREDTLFFEDLAFDMLVMDEIHRYKNLYSPRNRWGGAPKYLGGSGQSNRAYDTFLKASELRERTGGKNIYGLSASPTKNSPLEIYSILAHVAPDAFERLGIRNSEEFLDRFCHFDVAPVLSLQGEIEEATVVSGFKNLDELLPIMERYIYRKTAEDVGLKIPRAEPVVHIVDMTAAQQEVYEEIRRDMAKKADEASDIHIFRALDLMGKASIDLELIDPVKYKGEKSPLIEECVEAASLANQATGDGQIIFCDHIEVHEKIKAALVRRGVAPDRIIIMNAVTVPRSEDRYRASTAFNAGAYDFVIGNPPVIGEAVNLQENTGGTHVLGIPWEPEALKQMRGRGRRQGNYREVVHEHIYFDKGGCSAYRFQILSGKADWMQVLWSGQKEIENPARTGGFSRMELLIMLAPDPVAARAQYETDLQAAEDRHSLAGRGRAAQDFRRLQEMQASLDTIGEAGRATETGKRLARTEEVMRDKLLHSPHFGPKQVLSAASKSLYFPEGDIAISAGDVIRTVKDSIGRAVDESDIISMVDWKSQSVRIADLRELRDEGSMRSHADIVEGLKSGVLEIIPGAPGGRAALIAQALSLKPDGYKTIRIKHLRAFREFDDEWLEANAQNIQRHVYHAIAGYHLDDKIIPFVTESGKVGITSKFNFTRPGEGEGMKFLIPTQKNLAKLVALAIEVDRCFELSMKYPPGGRAGSEFVGASYGNYPSEVTDSGAHPNPALAAVRAFYGAGEFQTALNAAKEDALATMRTASQPAMILALGARLNTVQSYRARLNWSEESILAVAHRFAELGVLEDTMSQHIVLRSPGNKQGLSKAYLKAGTNMPDLWLSDTFRQYLINVAPNERTIEVLRAIEVTAAPAAAPDPDDFEPSFG